MTPQAAMIELLERFGASAAKAIFINEEELTGWPVEAVTAFKTQKLMTKAKPATSAICSGCERECVMPVHIIPAKENSTARAFISCDKRSDISRITVSLAKLNQWQCTIDSVREFVVSSLKLRQSNQHTDKPNLINIGIVKGNKRSQMLSLETDGVLSLMAGNSQLPLTELIEYRDSAYSLDAALIRQLVDSATTADNRYTPSNAKREARKLDTQAMYGSWQKEYRALKKKHPNMSDAWYSGKIAKMAIAYGRSDETIRKNMKLQK
ncbi:MAG: hypothetical protein H6937_11790 [Burkholderiales bacterium]|nr:hypothetical protein [Burkholderiales bacterium]